MISPGVPPSQGGPRLDNLALPALIVLGYVIGCFVTGYYLVRLRAGTDIRHVGSRSAGTLNVRRELGTRGALLTLAADMAKGAFACAIAVYYGLQAWEVTLVALAVIAGHVWPAQLGFRGGKGAATAGGTIMVLDFQVALGIIALFLPVLAVLRRFTRSGVVCVALAPVVALTLRGPTQRVLQIAVLAALVLFAHRENVIEILRARQPDQDDQKTRSHASKGIWR